MVLNIFPSTRMNKWCHQTKLGRTLYSFSMMWHVRNRIDNIRAYFSMGRHEHVDSFYLCQTYARIPKHLVRDNANLLVLFNQDDMNLKHIYNDHVNTNMPYSEFKNLCSACWVDRYGFIMIDKDSDLDHGRYRKGFDCFACIGK